MLRDRHNLMVKFVEPHYFNGIRIITGAGVSAGMDFGAALVGELRGAAMAEIATLVAAYAPEPPYRSGTRAEARPLIAAAASTMLAGFSADASALRPRGVSSAPT